MNIMSIGPLSELLSQRHGVKITPWTIRTLFRRGLLDDVTRVGPNRVFGPRDVARVERALKAAGYIGEGVPA